VINSPQKESAAWKQGVILLHNISRVEFAVLLQTVYTYTYREIIVLLRELSLPFLTSLTFYVKAFTRKILLDVRYSQRLYAIKSSRAAGLQHQGMLSSWWCHYDIISWWLRQRTPLKRRTTALFCQNFAAREDLIGLKKNYDIVKMYFLRTYANVSSTAWSVPCIVARIMKHAHFIHNAVTFINLIKLGSINNSKFH
jgi:hypothetical protein